VPAGSAVYSEVAIIGPLPQGSFVDLKEATGLSQRKPGCLFRGLKFYH
jgi:hypothetical protein